MCGIGAVFSYHRVAGPVDREEMALMNEAMSVRGPDGEGCWYSSDRTVALAHRRLSIIDLTEKASQPMSSEDGQLIISFNGEIYNYRELRRRLEAKGYRFISHSDTEVLLHLYSDLGIRMLSELRGMFAFALWDGFSRKLLLARDPYGIKPLYYADDGWQVRAASQVKALLSTRKLSREHEPAAIAGFFLLGSVPEPWTLYRGIQAVPAGHYVEVGGFGASEPRRWCDVASIFLNASSSRRNGAAAVAEIHDAFRESLRAHLVSDVPVGLFLSSGIDSGALAGLANDIEQPLEAMTLSFGEYADTAGDEAPLAREVAARYGLRSLVHHINGGEFADDLPRIVAAMDQPSTDGINTWLISRAAAEAGWKVALSGVGGDELLGGYPSFRDVQRIRFLGPLSSIPFLGSSSFAIASRLRRASARFGWNPSLVHPKIAGLLRYSGSDAGAYILRRGLFLPEELPEIIGPDLAYEGLRRLRPLKHVGRVLNSGTRSAASAFKVAALESSIYMRNQLLRDADWAGMAHSLEIRTPLVDVQLLRTIAPLLGTLRPDQWKQALAGAPAKSLPDQVRDRKKTGFTVPIQQWLEQDPRFDVWKRVPALSERSCPWSRRWAYTVMTLYDGSGTAAWNSRL